MEVVTPVSCPEGALQLTNSAGGLNKAPQGLCRGAAFPGCRDVGCCCFPSADFCGGSRGDLQSFGSRFSPRVRPLCLSSVTFFSGGNSSFEVMKFSLARLCRVFAFSLFYSCAKPYVCLQKPNEKGKTKQTTP